MGGVGEALTEVILVVVERAEHAARGRVQETRFEETQSDVLSTAVQVFLLHGEGRRERGLRMCLCVGRG